MGEDGRGGVVGRAPSHLGPLHNGTEGTDVGTGGVGRVQAGPVLSQTEVPHKGASPTRRDEETGRDREGFVLRFKGGEKMGNRERKRKGIGYKIGEDKSVKGTEVHRLESTSRMNDREIRYRTGD